MVYLGVDFGEKRVGIAISDPRGKVSMPLTILQRKDNTYVVNEICQICTSKKVSKIIVGDPGKDGRNQIISEHSDHLVKHLKQTLRGTDIKIERFSEHFSTSTARHNPVTNKITHTKNIDSNAASVMLQGYLDNTQNFIETIEKSWHFTKTPDLKALRKEIQEVSARNSFFADKWQNRKDYLKDPKVLRKILDELNEINTYAYEGGIGKLAFYAYLRRYLDQNNPEFNKHYNIMYEAYVQSVNKLQFVVINLSKVPSKQQNSFLKATELHPYQHFLELIFAMSKHTLSDREQKIFNLLTQTSYDKWVHLTQGFISDETLTVLDSKLKPIKIQYSQIEAYLRNPNRKVRKAAYIAKNKLYEKYSKTATAELNAILEFKKVSDELHKFDTPEQSRHMEDDIETDVVHAMISAVIDNYSIAHRYFKLKAKLLGFKKLQPYDLLAPHEKKTKKYSLKQAVTITHQIMSHLHPRFGAIFKDMVETGRIDFLPAKGKHSGAFCFGGGHIIKPYILTNFQEKVRDVTTIAHETGHAINDLLSAEAQNALNCEVPLSIAELASTFFEDFVFDTVSTNDDPQSQLALLMDKLEEDISAIFTQISLYQFEQQLHTAYIKENFLSREKISEIFRQNMTKHLGKIVNYPKIPLNWVTWTHIREFFYVYSYASGLLISKYFQRIVREDPANIDSVIKVLSAGNSDSPKNILQSVGVNVRDQAFWSIGLAQIDETLRKAEKLSNEI